MKFLADHKQAAPVNNTSSSKEEGTNTADVEPQQDVGDGHDNDEDNDHDGHDDDNGKDDNDDEGNQSSSEPSTPAANEEDDWVHVDEDDDWVSDIPPPKKEDNSIRAEEWIAIVRTSRKDRK